MAQHTGFIGGTLRPLREFFRWKRRNFGAQSPQFIKEKVFKRHGVPGGTWIETGTFKGDTTKFLSSLGGNVHTIEPAQKYYDRAVKKFAAKSNITVHNGTSEQILPKLLPSLSGDMNFWFDGHYSAGSTFQGETDCPVLVELQTLDANRGNYGQVTVMIDDVRCFGTDDPAYSDYPSLDALVDWARSHNMAWTIEHDIFIAKTT